MVQIIKIKEKREIFYNLVNSILAGALVFVGAFIDGELNKIEMLAAVGASGLIALTKFKEFWDGEKGQYSYNIANFV